jgi:hypothetical protein
VTRLRRRWRRGLRLPAAAGLAALILILIRHERPFVFDNLVEPFDAFENVTAFYKFTLPQLKLSRHEFRRDYFQLVDMGLATQKDGSDEL